MQRDYYHTLFTKELSSVVQLTDNSRFSECGTSHPGTSKLKKSLSPGRSQLVRSHVWSPASRAFPLLCVPFCFVLTFFLMFVVFEDGHSRVCSSRRVGPSLAHFVIPVDSQGIKGAASIRALSPLLFSSSKHTHKHEKAKHHTEQLSFFPSLLFLLSLIPSHSHAPSLSSLDT